MPRLLFTNWSFVMRFLMFGLCWSVFSMISEKASTYLAVAWLTGNYTPMAAQKWFLLSQQATKFMSPPPTMHQSVRERAILKHLTFPLLSALPRTRSPAC